MRKKVSIFRNETIFFYILKWQNETIFYEWRKYNAYNSCHHLMTAKYKLGHKYGSKFILDIAS